VNFSQLMIISNLVFCVRLSMKTVLLFYQYDSSDVSISFIIDIKRCNPFTVPVIPE